MIYFVACEAANAVKIGITEQRSYLSASASAFARLGALQNGCPLELNLLATCEGGEAEEAELHRRFAAHRIRGEWFTLTDELRAHIAQFPEPERLRRGWHSQHRNRSISNSAANPECLPMRGRPTPVASSRLISADS